MATRIYTKTGDDGSTGLFNGERVKKSHLRVEAYGTIDETNATIGLARLHTGASEPEIDAMLGRIQHDLFDLGADLCTPEAGAPAAFAVPRIEERHVARIERDIDALTDELPPLKAFILPGGTPAAAALHLCRTVCRRAERLMVALAAPDGTGVSRQALQYVNRLSDFFFVASRYVNDRGRSDVPWSKDEER